MTCFISTTNGCNGSAIPRKKKSGMRVVTKSCKWKSGSQRLGVGFKLPVGYGPRPARGPTVLKEIGSVASQSGRCRWQGISG